MSENLMGLLTRQEKNSISFRYMYVHIRKHKIPSEFRNLPFTHNAVNLIAIPRSHLLIAFYFYIPITYYDSILEGTKVTCSLYVNECEHYYRFKLNLKHHGLKISKNIMNMFSIKTVMERQC